MSYNMFLLRISHEHWGDKQLLKYIIFGYCTTFFVKSNISLT